MREIYRKDFNHKQFTRAGIVVIVLMLSGIAGSVGAREATVNKIRAEDRAMLVEMLKTGRNSVAIGKHETLGIAYAIPTDSILGVTKDGSNRIYCRNDGLSAFRVRLYRQKAPNPPTPIGAVVGDTMVIGCGAWGDTTKNPPIAMVQPTLKWTPISCNASLVPVPACVDTINSIPKWRTDPCAWLQNSETTVACYPLGTPRKDTVSLSSARVSRSSSAASNTASILRAEVDDRKKVTPKKP